MAIRIVTDTASDLELEELKKYNITCVPMSISFGNESYKDIFELDRDSFYEKMIASKELPKTSQPSPADFIPCFSEAKRNGDQLIVILLCSLLSGTYQSAVIAKTEVDYDGIYIIDSRTVTCGERFLIEVAMKCIDEGMSAKEIAEHVESIKSRVKILA